MSGPGIRRRAAAGVVALGVLLGAATAAADDRCTLKEAGPGETPALRVYFTKFTSEDKTGGRYRSCRLVKTAQPGTEVFVVTPFRPDANVVVHPDNWPRP